MMMTMVLDYKTIAQPLGAAASSTPFPSTPTIIRQPVPLSTSIITCVALIQHTIAHNGSYVKCAKKQQPQLPA